MISAISGMIITFIYDNIRCIRKVFKHNEFFIGFEDMLFWLGSSGFLVYIMYKYNYGNFRGFIIIGAIIGMVIYLFTISCVYKRVNIYILGGIKWCFVTFLQKLKWLLKIIIKKVKINRESNKKFTMLEGNKIEYEKKSKTQKE